MNKRYLTAFGVILCALFTLILAVSAAAQPVVQRPRLVVLLVADQMRGDYVDKYQQQWSAGLRRLVDQGAWYRLAALPYANTVTCAGHAVIGTGSFPSTTGVVLNAWWDRQNGVSVACTDDPSAPLVSYGGSSKNGFSAARLLVPTLADEMRAQLPIPPRVVTFSSKARAAIMLAGRRGDAVTWFEGGGWASSTAFTQAPVPFIEQYVKAHPVERDFGTVWDRVLPLDQYLYDDSTLGRTPLEDMGLSFPHPIKGKGEQPNPEFFSEWSESPLIDTYMGRMASAAVSAMRLGKGPGTDYLAVSFSGLDYVGHDFGPLSHEVQDTLVRLDQTIGLLLDTLDREVGAGNYVVAMTGDHGADLVPEQLKQAGIDAGRINSRAITERVERALEPHLGPGKHVAALLGSDLYFVPGVYDKLADDRAAMKDVLEAIRTSPGVLDAFRGEDLVNHRGDQDPLARAAALSYYPGRSGDLMVLARPHWIASNSATSHGTGHSYDQRVPILLMGAGIKPGQYLDAATPADIAHTLAFLCRVTLARPDGRVLSEALTPAEPVLTSSGATRPEPVEREKRD